MYEIDDIKRRWEDYIKELYDDSGRCDDLTEIDGKVEGFKIYWDEMEHAIRMDEPKKGNYEQDGTVAQTKKIAKLLKILNHVFHSGETLQAFLNSSL